MLSAAGDASGDTILILIALIAAAGGAVTGILSFVNSRKQAKEHREDSRTAAEVKGNVDMQGVVNTAWQEMHRAQNEQILELQRQLAGVQAQHVDLQRQLTECERDKASLLHQVADVRQQRSAMEQQISEIQARLVQLGVTKAGDGQVDG